MGHKAFRSLIVLTLAIMLITVLHTFIPLINLTNISNKESLETWEDTLVVSGQLAPLASLAINNTATNINNDFTVKLPLKKGKNHFTLKAKLLVFSKTISFDVSKLEDVSLNIPQYTSSPLIKVTGRLNPSYTLITNAGTFTPDEVGNINAIIDQGFDNFKKDGYTLNFKILNPQSKIVFSDIKKIYNDQQAFVNLLIQDSRNYLKKDNPYLKYVAEKYNVIDYEGDTWAVVAFITNDKIDNTEVVAKWGKQGWEPILAGSEMDIRENFYSPEVFKILHNYQARKRLLSPKVELAIAQKYAQEREKQQEKQVMKEETFETAYQVALSDLNKEYLKYVGGIVKVNGRVLSINEKYLTTDIVLSDASKNYIHLRAYKRINLKVGDAAEFLGQIQGDREVYLAGKNYKLISLLVTQYKKL